MAPLSRCLRALIPLSERRWLAGCGSTRLHAGCSRALHTRLNLANKSANRDPLAAQDGRNFVVAYGYAARAYDFTAAVKALKHQYPDVKVYFREVAHVPFPRPDPPQEDAGPESDQDAFMFSDGTVVLWAVNENSQRNILDLVAPFRTDVPRPDAGHASTGQGGEPEVEMMQLRRGDHCGFDNKSHSIVLASEGKLTQATESGLGANTLEKVAMSHGIQRSLKLDRLERVMDVLESTLRPLSKNIMSGLGRGKKAVQRETMQKLGEIFELRVLLNLRGTLETPDAYWDRRDLEQIYSQIAREFDLQDRIALLNKKLDYAHEIVDFRHRQLSEANGTRLTNWIIVLILCTITVESYKTYKRMQGEHDAVPEAAEAQEQGGAPAVDPGSLK